MPDLNNPRPATVSSRENTRPGPTRAGISPARLAYLFYALAAAGAVIGQVWVALVHVPWPVGWPLAGRVGVVLPFAFCLELFGMATAYLADERMRAGERAYGFRVLSVLAAGIAVGVIVVGHWPAPYEVVGFGGLSVAAYALWLLHAGARRRDALRAAGLLAAVAPAYGWYRRLRHPVVTARAAELARERGLGLYESVRAAELALRAEGRRPSIAAAVGDAIRADHADPRMAEIAARTLDLDRIAVELESRADYAGWADRLAPAVLAHQRPDPSVDVSGHELPAPSTGRAVSSPDPVPGTPQRAARSRSDSRRQPAAQRVPQLAAQRPDMSAADLARLAGVSERHVRRVLTSANGHVRKGQATQPVVKPSSGANQASRDRTTPAGNNPAPSTDGTTGSTDSPTSTNPHAPSEDRSQPQITPPSKFITAN